MNRFAYRILRYEKDLLRHWFREDFGKLKG
jgi:hypothetical protein